MPALQSCMLKLCHSYGITGEMSVRLSSIEGVMALKVKVVSVASEPSTYLFIRQLMCSLRSQLSTFVKSAWHHTPLFPYDVLVTMLKTRLSEGIPWSFVEYSLISESPMYRSDVCEALTLNSP